VDALREYFNAADESALRGFTGRVAQLHFANYILRQLDLPPRSRILDIGCGDGAVLAAVKELRADLDCVGVDFAEKQIEKARSGRKFSGLEFKVRNVLKDPFDFGTFDRIYSFSVVQYFTPEDFRKACLNLRLSLRKNGILVHMSIPDLAKRVLLFHQSFLDERSVRPWRSLLHLAKIVLVDMKRRALGDRYYGSDSFFHDPQQLAEICGQHFQSRVVRPSDSWYRFDIHLTPR
jgi:cyclopropane fatty-acyl-phospholipid synthase-like methyltransferase